MHRRYVHIIIVSISVLLSLPGSSQLSFKTVVPQQPIILGESFRVQYVVENEENVSHFSWPFFGNFRVVRGPDIYTGETTVGYKKLRSRNMVFTLVAIKRGRFIIQGAACMVKDRLIKSNDAMIEVISSKEEADLKKINDSDEDNSLYFLEAGEDPMKKIRENLFLKVMVDKHSCFLGEPLVATFKLYSRLQSRSDVIKNPGFYGFSVYDMINVNDKVKSSEKLKGHWFDVHIIRKLQLYPLQTGNFTIDEMELANKVEFSRSKVNRKTEQEVVENMYGNKETGEKQEANAEVYEMNIISEPVSITVKPLPGKTPVDSFAGAVGNFLVKAFVEKDSLLKNEEGSLTVEVSGAGNFQRVNAAVINWPAGIEAFEPAVTDNLDKQTVPLTGQRSFKYVFVSNQPGVYKIPSISFSFFDLKTRSFKTLSTKPIPVFVSHKSKAVKSLVVKSRQAGTNNKLRWLTGAAALLVLLAGMILWLRNRQRLNRKRSEAQRAAMNVATKPPPSVEELLLPPRLANDDRSFYEELDHAVWNYFNLRLQLSGSQVNKESLRNIFIAKAIQPRLANEITEILNQCETGMYTQAEIEINKFELFEKTKRVLVEIEESLVKVD